MHSLDPILERMLTHLATKLGYDLSLGELNLYREELTKYALFELAEAMVKAESEYQSGLFPSLAWFKLRLGDRLEENYNF